MAFYNYAEALRNAEVISRGIARAMKSADGREAVRANFGYEWHGIMSEDCFGGRELDKWPFRGEIIADNNATRRVKCVFIDYETSDEAEDLIRKSVVMHNADGQAFGMVRRFNEGVGKLVEPAKMPNCYRKRSKSLPITKK